MQSHRQLSATQSRRPAARRPAAVPVRVGGPPPAVTRTRFRREEAPDAAPAPAKQRSNSSAPSSPIVLDGEQLAQLVALPVAAMEQSSRALDEALDAAAQHARDGLGWLRHALTDPDDFGASAIGRMVSKEYGKHEPAHTEHHLLRGGKPASPRAAAAAAQQGQQPTAGLLPDWLGGGARDGGASKVFEAPPSGPGFLLAKEQQQQQRRH